MQSPEDHIALSLISRDESELQIGRRRFSEASEAFNRFVISVWPPTPPCCRGGGKGEGRARRVIGVAAHLGDLLVAVGVKLQHLFFAIISINATLPPLSPGLSISEQEKSRDERLNLLT